MSCRGIPKLVDNGCMFVRYRETGTRIAWRCDLSSSHHCKAKVSTDGEVIVKRVGDHNHAGNAAKIEIAKMMEGIYQRAEMTQDGTSKIVSDALASLSPATLSQVPNVSSIKRLILRNRSKKVHLPPLPLSFEEFTVAEEFQTTESGAQFLKADLAQGRERYLIFATDGALETLARCETWFVDGTFKLTMPLFQKLYVILGVFTDAVIPLVYVLMTSATEEGYLLVLSKLLEVEPLLNPRTIFGDFDMASFGAICKTFRDAVHYGCFFQFCQIFYSSMQALNLQRSYDMDAEFALKMRLLPALSFISADEVSSAFESIAMRAQFPVEAIPLLDHFEDTWIGRPVCGKARRATLFPIRFWNCADIIDVNVVRLNSMFEAWQRYFSSQLATNGSNVWKVIKFFRLDQSRNEATLASMLSGGEVKVNAKTQPKSAFKKLENVINIHDKGDTLEFLHSVASCLFF